MIICILLDCLEPKFTVIKKILLHLCHYSSINVIISDVPGLIDKEKVRQLQAELLDFLEYYLSS